MRLFFYYAFHTIINTLKKLLKTWIAIFIVLGVCGGLIGILIGRIVPLIVENVKGDDTAIEQTVDVPEEDADDIEDEAKSKINEFLEANNFTKIDVVDLLVTACFLLIVTLCLSSVNKGGEFFKPADVPILFSSPLKPQSVLLFRLLNSLGSTLFVSLYMLFQMPNLVHNVGMNVGGAFMIIAAYMLTLMFATLLQVGLYTVVCSTKKGSINIGGILVGFYAALLAGFMAYVSITKQGLAVAVFKFFGSSKVFWIPFWGWIRGMIYHAVNGNMTMSFIYMGLFIVALVAFVIVIWNIKVDFYENAMFATERVAAKLEGQKSVSKGGVMQRDKERSEKMERDGFRYGFGASVFFYKTVYNRFRFAKLKIFTVPFTIYLVSSIAGSFIARNIEDAKISLFFIPASIIAAVTFYKNLGNSVEEDTSREFFVLIPEKPLKKIWASILGTVAVCGIDIIIPLIISAIMTGTNPLSMLTWFIYILSICVFTITIGAFINLSIPGNVAETLKASIQAMFVIMGILPMISFIAVGLIFNVEEIALLIGAAFNVGIGALFTIFTPKFLENR